MYGEWGWYFLSSPSLCTACPVLDRRNLLYTGERGYRSLHWAKRMWWGHLVTKLCLLFLPVCFILALVFGRDRSIKTLRQILSAGVNLGISGKALNLWPSRKRKRVPSLNPQRRENPAPSRPVKGLYDIAMSSWTSNVLEVNGSSAVSNF